MKFGSTTDISKVDFTLPPDKRDTARVLKRNKTRKNPEIYIGCPIWTHPKWVGKIFPSKTKAADFLYYYSRQFNSIELNATFYRLPSAAVLKHWEEAVPGNFRFCPKIPQFISRSLGAKNISSLNEQYYDSISLLGKKLGMSFLQLAPTFSSEKKNLLMEYLDRFPKDIPLAVELRHASWFENRTVFNELFDYLEKLSICAIITDVPGRRDVLHQRLTTSSAFIRFNANDLHPSDFSRLDDWAVRIKSWLDMGLEKLFFFMHTADKSLNPELCNYLIEKLNKRGNLNLKKAEISEKNERPLQIKKGRIKLLA